MHILQIVPNLNQEDEPVKCTISYVYQLKISYPTYLLPVYTNIAIVTTDRLIVLSMVSPQKGNSGAFHSLIISSSDGWL